ncbi:hypothetical protein MKX01_020554, partial [Papaver californicum]
DWESSGDDDSVVEENPMQLMDRVGLLDGVLAELEHERHQEIKVSFHIDFHFCVRV